MNRYLLDSDVLMDFFKKRPESISLVTNLSKEGILSASILSITELRAGWTKEQAKFFLPRFYRLLRIEKLNLEIAEAAGKFRQEYKLKGVALPTIDTLIAATCAINGYILVTRNKKDFPMPEIKLYDF